MTIALKEIHISNEKKRDANVRFVSLIKENDPKLAYKGKSIKNSWLLISSDETSEESLLKQYKSKLAENILNNEIEPFSKIARQYKQQLANKGYLGAVVMEDNRGDLRLISEDEMDREENKRTSSLKAELPPLENIIFRVQLGIEEEIDTSGYDVDDQVWVAKDDVFIVYSGEFSSYEEAAEHRNGYLAGYEQAKIIALKDGLPVNTDEYMDYGKEESEAAVYGDITFQIQIGIFGDNVDEEMLEPIRSLDGINTTEMGDGLIRYTVGNYTSLQRAMINHSTIEKAGFENTYIIAFYNGTQISLKKAQELQGF